MPKNAEQSGAVTTSEWKSSGKRLWELLAPGRNAPDCPQTSGELPDPAAATALQDEVTE